MATKNGLKPTVWSQAECALMWLALGYYLPSHLVQQLPVADAFDLKHAGAVLDDDVEFVTVFDDHRVPAVQRDVGCGCRVFCGAAGGEGEGEGKG